MTPCLKVTCLLFRVLLLWKWLIQTLYLDDSFCADSIAYMIAVSLQIMENVQAVRNPFSMVLFIGVQVELLIFVYLTQSTYMSKVPLMLWQPLGNHKVHGKSNIFKKVFTETAQPVLSGIFLFSGIQKAANINFSI